MDNEILVKVEGVSKKFCRNLKRSLWYGLKDMSAEVLGGRGNHDQLRKDEFWAVKDVRFELKRGECLGLLGHNGAGKSTLLKMLNGLIKPDKGSITMKGRIGALIELGAGFNPILTGRENIYINGQILGFTKREVDAKFDAIVEFAEINEFIDMPVQNYSSGMKVRLGFAIAAQMEPDILIIDEVLAVGDLGFRIKCFNKITDLLKDTAVIFVSHQMPQVLRICNIAMLMNHGDVVHKSTDVSGIVSEYYKYFGNENYYQIGDLVSIDNLCLNGVKRFQFSIDFGAAVNINFNFTSKVYVSRMRISFAFFDLEQKAVGSDLLFLNDIISDEQYNLSYNLPQLFFNNGAYSISIVFMEMIDDVPKILSHYSSIIKIHTSGFLYTMVGSIKLNGVFSLTKK